MKFSSKKVLIVEDDVLLSMVAVRTVQNLGHKVMATADNGKDALSEVQKHRPDLIIMDMRLKGEWDGIETVERIKEQFSIPVIYLSGSSYAKSLKHAEEVGFSAFLQKPLRKDELKKAFQKVFKDEKVIASENKKKVG